MIRAIPHDPAETTYPPEWVHYCMGVGLSPVNDDWTLFGLLEALWNLRVVAPEECTEAIDVHAGVLLRDYGSLAIANHHCKTGGEPIMPRRGLTKTLADFHESAMAGSKGTDASTKASHENL